MHECKTCKRCGETKPLDQFHRRSTASDGRRAKCKVCAVDENREREEAKRGAPIPRRHRHEPADEHGKTCCTCEKRKPLTDFYRQTNGNPSSDCKVCVKARLRAVRAPHLTRAPNSYADNAGKACPKCQDFKPYAAFAKPKAGGFGTYCRPCRTAIDRAAKRRHRDEVNQARREQWATPPSDPDSVKWCPRCRQHRPLTEFGLSGKRGYCTPCRQTYGREHHHKHRDRRRQEKYGWTADQFAELLDKQGGVCAICGSATVKTGRPVNGDGRDLHVDHDHTSGRVRGLLCNRCNVTLGLMDDDPDRLFRAAQYLKSPPAFE